MMVDTGCDCCVGSLVAAAGTAFSWAVSLLRICRIWWCGHCAGWLAGSFESWLDLQVLCDVCPAKGYKRYQADSIRKGNFGVFE